MKRRDLDLRTQSVISKISSSFLSLQDFLISSFNENLLYEFFKRYKPAVLSAPLLIISVYVHENPAFSKSPRITVNQMIMFKLKNTSQQPRAVRLLGIILTLSHFHYPSTVTVRDGNKGGTNSVKQKRKEKGGLMEEKVCLQVTPSLRLCQILIKHCAGQMGSCSSNRGWVNRKM